MNPFEDYIRIHRNPLSLVEHYGEKAVHELVEIGFDVTEARAIRRIFKVYFGKTTHPAVQEKSRQAAREMKHPMRSLERIIRSLARVKDKALRPQLLLELSGTAPEAVRELAKVRVAELNPPEEVDNAPRASVRNPSETMTTLSITAPSSQLAPLINGMRQHHESHDRHKMGDAFFALLSEGVAKENASVTIGIMLDELDDIISGAADEVKITRTDGTIVTGAEVAETLLRDNGYAMLIHPQKGPVNLYEARFASPKLRHMAEVMNPVCGAPDCSRGAIYCQMHHIKPWAQGGTTSPDNLVTCCRYHNGRNDDTRDGDYGYLTVNQGTAFHVNSRTGWMTRNAHPAMQHSMPVRHAMRQMMAS